MCDLGPSRLALLLCLSLLRVVKQRMVSPSYFDASKLSSSTEPPNFLGVWLLGLCFQFRVPSFCMWFCISVEAFVDSLSVMSLESMKGPSYFDSWSMYGSWVSLYIPSKPLQSSNSS